MRNIDMNLIYRYFNIHIGLMPLTYCMEAEKKFTHEKAALDKYLAEEKEWSQAVIFDSKFKVVMTLNTSISEDEMK